MTGITEAVIGKLLDTLALKTFDAISAGAKKVASEIYSRTKDRFKNYILTTSGKYSHLRTFFVRDESKYLYDFYIPASVQIGNHRLLKVNIHSLSQAGKRFLILGNAGAGKSILMRHLFLDCIISAAKIPVFVELRNLDAQAPSLANAVLKTLNELGLDINGADFEELSKQGVFCFLFDGFDEVPLGRRTKLAKELANFSLGTDCLVVVSSRPDLAVQGWHGFTHATVCSLTLQEACALVEKVPFDSEIKDRFLQKLQSDLYASHQSFASNPLLLSIMLMTFETYAEIPSKFSIFYSQAYETLFQKHDAQKAYVRERLTQHDIVDFERLFSAFCLITYDKKKFRFSIAEAIEIMKKVSDITGIKTDPENYILDAKQAVCLLVEDGLELSFTHRSFQEYFVAKFLADLDEGNQKRLLKQAAKSIGQDNVLLFLYEMKPKLVEALIVLPSLKLFFRRLGVKRSFTYANWLKFMDEYFSHIHIDARQFGLRIKPGTDLNFLNFVAIKNGFVADHVRSLASFDHKAAEEFSEKYRGNKPPGESQIVKLSDAPPEMMQDLSKVKSIWNFEVYVTIKKVLRELEKKHENQDKTLLSLIK